MAIFSRHGLSRFSGRQLQTIPSRLDVVSDDFGPDASRTYIRESGHPSPLGRLDSSTTSTRTCVLLRHSLRQEALH